VGGVRSSGGSVQMTPPDPASATYRFPARSNVIPDGLQGEAAGLGRNPTTAKVGPDIFQTGQRAGGAARPVVYRFPLASPVSPSMANGVIACVVKVGCRGNGDSPGLAGDSPEPRTRSHDESRPGRARGRRRLEPPQPPRAGSRQPRRSSQDEAVPGGQGGQGLGTHPAARPGVRQNPRLPGSRPEHDPALLRHGPDRMGRQEPAQSAVAAARVPRLDNPLTRRQLLRTMLAAGGLADVVLAQELRRFKVAYASPRRAAPSGWRTKRDASRPTVSSPSSSSSAGRRPARRQPWDRERAAGRG